MKREKKEKKNDHVQTGAFPSAAPKASLILMTPLTRHPIHGLFGNRIYVPKFVFYRKLW